MLPTNQGMPEIYRALLASADGYLLDRLCIDLVGVCVELRPLCGVNGYQPNLLHSKENRIIADKTSWIVI
jgi:hypothetical protein